MRFLLNSTRSLYFIGIGGIGMSGIAEILHNLGYCVKGSDQSSNYNIKRLRDLGIEVFIGHEAQNVDQAAVVIISSAIKEDNPELKRARQLKIPVIRRAEMLAELMRLKKSIAISGTHGKTTTTSLIASLLEANESDPTVVNGGIINAYGTNARLGAGEWIVVEADESDGSFIKLPATIAVVTNIDPEHMDFYKDFDHLRKAFLTFVEQIPFYGLGILCIDHPEVNRLASMVTDRRILTYGFSEEANVRATNLRHSSLGTTFDVFISPTMHADDEKVAVLPLVIKDLFLPMMGDHNVQNSLTLVCVAYELGMSEKTLRTALQNFSGVKRRFTKTGITAGITVIDDYAHHPVEIETVLKAAHQTPAQKIIAVFQPHRYSRVSSLKDDFYQCFQKADSVIVCPIYAAGESPIEGLDHHVLAKGIQESSCRQVHTADHFDDIVQRLTQIANPGDYIICLGAGNITEWAANLPEALSRSLIIEEAS